MNRYKLHEAKPEPFKVTRWRIKPRRLHDPEDGIIEIIGEAVPDKIYNLRRPNWTPLSRLPHLGVISGPALRDTYDQI